MTEEKLQAHKGSRGPKCPKFSGVQRAAAIQLCGRIVALVDLRGFRHFSPAGLFSK